MRNRVISGARVETGVPGCANCQFHSMAKTGDDYAFVPDAQVHGCFKQFQHNPINA
jgi:hypothetical protein